MRAHNLVPQNVYVYKNNRWIETLSTDTVESILVYISSSYELSIPSTTRVHKLMPVETAKQTTYNQATDPYARISDADLDRMYSLSNDQTRNDLYKHPICIREESQEDIGKGIRRQMHRLRFCIHGSPYDISIIRGTLVGLHRKKTRVFKAPTLSHKIPLHRVLIVVPFNIFYDKIAGLVADVGTIYRGIDRLLTNTQSKHMQNLQTLLQKQATLTRQNQRLATARDALTTCIQKYVKLVENLNQCMDQKREKLRAASDQNSGGYLRSDLKRSNRRVSLEKELREMQQLRNRIVTAISELKSKHTNLTLSVDERLFDSSIMLEKVLVSVDALQDM